MDPDVTMFRKNDEAYAAWKFAVSAVAELLLLSNSSTQDVMAHVAGPEEWSGNAITIVARFTAEHGRDARDFEERLRLGDMSALKVWDGHTDGESPEANRVLEKLWPDGRRETPAAIAERLACHIGLELHPPRDGVIERCEGEIWARIFAASVDALHCIESDYPWVLQTSYRDGAGRYVHFDPCGILFQGFYLNKSGYISGNRDDWHLIQDASALEGFDIARTINSGASREQTKEELLSVIQPMIDRIESRGFDGRFNADRMR